MNSDKFDVIVVGGGAIGCCLAYYLAKEGVKVLVLEKEGIGNQASSGAVGLFSIDTKPFAHDRLREAAIWSRQTYAKLSQEFKKLYGNDLEHETCGILRVAKTSKDLEDLREEAAWHRSHVVNDVQELSPQEIKTRWPQVEGPTSGGTYYPRDTQITSSKVVAGFYAAAQDFGAIFKENSSVDGFETSGHQVTQVRSGSASFTADRVILAAGSWMNFAAKPLGVSFPIEPVRGQLLIFQMKDRLLSCPVTLGGAEYFYLVPKQDGHLYAGTTLEKAGFDTVPTQGALDKIADEVTAMVPKVADLPIRGSWAGLRPATPDNLPLIGRVGDYKNLWIAGGHYRKGILLAPWSGQTMADLLLGRKPMIPIEAFSPRRFQMVPAPSI